MRLVALLALALAGEVQEALGDEKRRRPLLAAYGDNSQTMWEPELPPESRLQVVLNAFTRMRICTREGLMGLGFKETPAAAPPANTTWA